MRKASNIQGVNKYTHRKSQPAIQKESDVLGSSAKSQTALKKIEVLSQTYDPSTSIICKHEFDDDYFADSSEDMGPEGESEKTSKASKKSAVGNKSKKKKVKVEEPSEEENTESGQLFSNIDSLPSNTERSEATRSRHDFTGNVRDDFKDVFQGTGSRKASTADFSGDATVDFYENMMRSVHDFSGSVVDDFVDQIKQDEISNLTRADFNGDVAVDFGRLAVYSFSRKLDVPTTDFSGNVVDDFREQLEQSAFSDDDVNLTLAEGGVSSGGIVKFNALVERDFKDLLRLYKNFRIIKNSSKEARASSSSHGKKSWTFGSRQDRGNLLDGGELSGSQRRTLRESFESVAGNNARVSLGGPVKLNSSELYTVFSAAKFASEAGLKVPGVDKEGFVEEKFVDFLQDKNQHTDVRYVINECAINRPEFKDTENFHNYIELYRDYYTKQSLLDFQFEDMDVNAFALLEQQFKQYLRLVNMFTVAKMYSESGRFVPGIDGNGFVDERLVDYLNKIFNVNVRKVINDSALLTPGPELKGQEQTYFKEYLYFYSKAIPDPDMGLTFQSYGSSSHQVSAPSCVGCCKEKCEIPDAANGTKGCDPSNCKSVTSYPVTRDCSTSIRECGCERQGESSCHALRPSCDRCNKTVQTQRTVYVQDEEDNESSDDSENECICKYSNKKIPLELVSVPDVDSAKASRMDVGATVERRRSLTSGDNARRYSKEPRLSHRSSHHKMSNKDASRDKRKRKLSFTAETSRNASSASPPEKIEDEDDHVNVKESGMSFIFKNGEKKGGRNEHHRESVDKRRKLSFQIQDYVDNERQDGGEMSDTRRSSHSAVSQKKTQRLPRSASERTDRACKIHPVGSRHDEESVEDSTLSRSRDSDPEPEYEEEPVRRSRSSRRTSQVTVDQAAKAWSASSSPSRVVDESDEDYSNKEEVVSEDDMAHARNHAAKSRGAGQQVKSVRARSTTHVQENNNDSDEEYFTEDELRQELAECRRQLRSQSYDPAMARSVMPVGSVRRPESDSEDERARGSCYNGKCSRRPTPFMQALHPVSSSMYDEQMKSQRKPRAETYSYNEPPKQKLKGFPQETTFRCYVERNLGQGSPVYLHGAPVFERQPEEFMRGHPSNRGNSDAIYHCTLDNKVPAIPHGSPYDNGPYQTMGQQSQMIYPPDPQADYGRRMHGEAGGGNYAANSSTGCNFTANGSPICGGSPGSNVDNLIPSCAPTGCNCHGIGSPLGNGNIVSHAVSSNVMPFFPTKSTTSNYQPTGSPVIGGGNFLPFVLPESPGSFGSHGSPVENFAPAGTNAGGHSFGPSRECVGCSNFGPNRECAVSSNYEPNRECYSCGNCAQNKEFPPGGSFAQNREHPAGGNYGQNREYPVSGNCGANRECAPSGNFVPNRESVACGGGGYGQQIESYGGGSYVAMNSPSSQLAYQSSQYDPRSRCCGGMVTSPVLSARPSQQLTPPGPQHPMTHTESWSQRCPDYGHSPQNHTQKYQRGSTSGNPPPNVQGSAPP